MKVTSAATQPLNHRLSYRLASHPIPADRSHCRIDFYFYINPGNNSVAVLHVYSLQRESGRVSLWSSEESASLQWRHGWANINRTLDFVIVFEAMFTGVDDDSVIAIDDISFRRCGEGMCWLKNMLVTSFSLLFSPLFVLFFLISNFIFFACL